MKITSSHLSQTYIKADNNILINEKCISWVAQMDECLIICTKKDGCDIRDKRTTHKICKINNPDSYDKFMPNFK